MGSELIFNIPDRAAYLLNKYKIKYNKLINFPNWEDSELEEMSESLKENILNTLLQSKDIKQRLSILTRVSKGP